MMTITNDIFEPKQILDNLVNTVSTGYLRINSNSIRWDIHLQQGELKFACYSVQNLQSIKHILLRNNFHSTVQTLKNYQLDSLAGKSVFTIVNQLLKDQLIDLQQQRILHQELTEEAIELFLWLKDGSYEWSTQKAPELPNMNQYDYAWDIPALMDTMKIRLQAWQQFNPLIDSPFQRIVCPNLELLEKSIPNGNLAPSLLKQLFTLVQGGTIRQIAVVLKKSDLRTIQLLIPYLKHRVLLLKSTNIPFNKLPVIPRKQLANNFDVQTITIPNSAIQSELKPLSFSEPPSTTVGNKFSTEQKSPFVSPTPESKLPTPPSESVVKNKTFKIVSIDDSPAMLDMIRSYLDDEQKYDVSTLENPMLSLGILFKVKPDLILMDFSMPGINGYKLCGILRKSHVFKNTPIIMVSGNLNLIEEGKWHNSGITDYVAKPFNCEDLKNIIDKYLGN